MNDRLTIISFILCLCYSHLYCLEFQTIGIYSLCNGNHTQDEFTEYAHAVDSFVVKDPRISNDHPFVRGRTSYMSFDVCYDHEKFTKVLIELLLNSTFYAVNKSDIWKYQYYWDVEIDKWHSFAITAERTTTIIRIIAHIPAEMLQTLLDVLSIENQIVFTVHSPLITITDRMRNRANFFNMKTPYEDLLIFLKKKGWENILVLQNQTKDPFYATVLNDIMKILKTSNDICLKSGIVYSEIALRKTFAKDVLLSNPSNDLIVIDIGTLYGIGVYKINESSNYYKNIINIDLFQSYFKVPKEYQFHYYKRPRIHLFKLLRGERFIISNSEASQILIHQTNLAEDMRLFHSTLSLFKKYRSALSFLIRSTKVIEIDAFAERGKVYWSDILETVFLRFTSLYGNRISYEGQFNIQKTVVSKCFNPICQEGTEKKYSKLPKWAAHWDSEIGYFCQPCKRNYIKPTIGDGQCKPCLGYFISNKARSKCLDPLRPVHYMFTDTPGIITLIISIAGCSLCLFTLVTFIKHRQTPIVKSSDFILSFIHLLANLSYFCTTPPLYFLLPTKGRCIARTLSIALLYNLNTSVTFTKSNKMLKAFSTNVRATKMEVLKTQLTQTFIIFIDMISAVLLIVAFWVNKPPEAKVRIEIEKTQKVIYCSNGYENIFVSSLMLLLHLACFIQAFRCRKLPNHLNEAMNIVYASFIATVSLCVMFPIYFSQKLEEDGELVVVLVLTGNSLILFLFMYAKKVITIFFKPEKNRKEYFRMKFMEALQSKAKKIKAKSTKESDIATTEL